MHVHHADRQLPQSSRGCASHSPSDAQLTLRRKALLQVAASAASAPATVAPASNSAVCTTAPAGSVPESSTYDLAAMRRQKGSLSILTQDGDTVQIRFRTQEGVAVQSSTTTTADGTDSSTSVYSFASGRVQVGVEGELDAEELKAIGDLMDKVDSLATQFFAGDAQAAFSAASELGFDAGEIAGFALRLSVKEFARATVQAPPTPATPDSAAATEAATQAAPAPTPVAAPAPAAPVAEAPASVEPAAVATDPVAAAPTPDTAAVPNAAGTTDQAAALQKTLGDILKQVVEGLSSVSGSGRAEFSMRWKLQVMIQAVQSAPSTAGDPAGTQLATDSLDKLAAVQA
jgi:hypothetical protein